MSHNYVSINIYFLKNVFGKKIKKSFVQFYIIYEIKIRLKDKCEIWKWNTWSIFCTKCFWKLKPLYYLNVGFIQSMTFKFTLPDVIKKILEPSLNNTTCSVGTVSPVIRINILLFSHIFLLWHQLLVQNVTHGFTRQQNRNL